MRAVCRKSLSFLIFFALPGFVLANPSPPNDDFENAIELTGFPVTISGTTAGSTVEPGEPSPWWGPNNGSVWYRWTAPHTGALRMVAEGCVPIASLWSGEALETLDHVYQEWDGTGDPDNLRTFSFPVMEGITYHISVSQDYYGGGDFVLTLYDQPPQISGRVTGPDGETPVVELSVWIMQECPEEDCWDIAYTTAIDANGEYQVSVAPGTYRVWFRIPPWSPIEGFAEQVYPGAAHLPLGADVVVGIGADAEGIDAVLGPPPVVRGRVTEPDGETGLADINVFLVGWRYGFCPELGFWPGTPGWDGLEYWTTTDANGAYEFSDIEAGIYRIVAVDSGGNHAVTYYDGASTLTTATDLPLASGAILEGIDLVMTLPAQILGRVTDMDGATPLPGVRVSALAFDPDRNVLSSDTGWHEKASAITDAQGHYAIPGLGAGCYRVRFQDPDQLVAYYPGAGDIVNAADVMVVSGEWVEGIDISLAPAGRLRGRVLYANSLEPLHRAAVRCFRLDVDSWSEVAQTFTDASGVYEFVSLPTGNYRVRFTHRRSWHAPLLEEFFDNALSLETATDVLVEAGKVTSGVNAVLGIQEVDVPAEFIGSIPGEGSTLNLHFVGMPGRDYLLRLARDSFDEWLDAHDPIACMPGTNSVTVDLDGATGIFQLRRLP